MAEREHYEHVEYWTAERYLGLDVEVTRFNTTIDMIPDDTVSLLDVGCGNGAFMYFIEQKKLPLRLLGLERSNAAISRKLCQAEIQYGSADELPYEDHSFDMVSALEVIEHLPFGVYEQVLRELERVAGKYIMISVPYQEQRRLVLCPYCGCRFNLYYHLRSFDDNKMENLLQDFSLIDSRKVETSQYLFRNFLWSLRNHFMPERSFPATTCPQCSYSKPPKTTEGHIAKADSTLKRLMPRVKRIFWVVALYQRRSSL